MELLGQILSMVGDVMVPWGLIACAMGVGLFAVGQVLAALRPLGEKGGITAEEWARMDDESADLLTRRDRLIDELRELEFEARLNKIGDDDLARLKRSYETEALALMDQLDNRVEGYAARIELDIAGVRKKKGPTVQPGPPPVVAPTPPPAAGAPPPLEAVETPSPEQPVALLIKPTAVQCAACEAPNEPDAAFCDACGQAMGALCGGCETRNRAGAQFCKGCGEALEEAG